jgi:hypothetical protein
MRMKSTILMLLALIFFCSEGALGQRQSPSNVARPARGIEPAGCELNNIILEQAHTAAGDSISVLIGRPGVKDRRRDITGKRLYTARAYLTDYFKKRGVETVVTGTAPNNGAKYGVVEIFVKGQLFDVLASYPDAELGLGSCDSLESDDRESRARRALLYPWIFKKR